MNLLFRFLYAQKCSSTHHKLAMDALRYLRCPESDAWVRLFLSEIELYTAGAKAPDKTFKDFRNHVLHVADNFWGGAVPTAEKWYGHLVEQLKSGQWARAVYCAGVLSHYVTDPLMPLHTGQTEDEGQVHKFIEWGTAKIYEELVATHAAARALQNWKPPEHATSEDWLALLVIEGATGAHGHYDVMIDHYDPHLGAKNPSSGFDETCKSSLAMLLGWSIRAMAHVLGQAITESAVSPPSRRLTLATVLSGLSTPLFWVTRQLASREDRKAVKAIYDELQATGKVIETLPEDDRIVRAAHADEVLGISLKELDAKSVRRAGSLRTGQVRPAASPEVPTEKPRPEVRFYLELDSPVVDAPSIGPRTAKRLHQIDIHSVRDLLDAHVDAATEQLNQRWITADVFREWQLQATLVCRIPGLRGHDAQLLVAVGITGPEQLRDAEPDLLLNSLKRLAKTREGERILRSSKPPDRVEIARWISSTDDVRTLRAA